MLLSHVKLTSFNSVRLRLRFISSAVFLQHHNGSLSVNNGAAIRAALKADISNGEITGILAIPDNNNKESIIAEARKLSGLTKIITCLHPTYERLMPEPTASILSQLQKQNNYTHWWTAHSSVGKGIFPRFAGVLLRDDNGEGVAPISDVTNVISESEFVRPIYAGNAITKLKSTAKVNIITVRPTSFPPPEGEVKEVVDLPAEQVTIEPSPECLNLSEWEGEEVSKSDRPDLATADIVISGGRALKSADNFKLLYDLADAIGGAAVGASRAAVDAGYVANELQIGQTGKIVAPKLYIAIGISGAIQHIAGMKDSRTIISINKDPDCPIFQISDYYLVGDLFTILPEMISKLKK